VRPLFGYGTFCREAWRRTLFGADYAVEPATLPGWRRAAVPSGYLSIVPDAGASVRGLAIVLDAAGWAIADAWEDVPLYHRTVVEVTTERGPLSALTYVYAHAAELDATPVADDVLALVDDAAVEAALAQFAPRMHAIRADFGAGTTLP
jgi:gamma-glutamylcyclotransferase (GGCT)/AIG2-like uncharacterized protein YtfP